MSRSFKFRDEVWTAECTGMGSSFSVGAPSSVSDWTIIFRREGTPETELIGRVSSPDVDSLSIDQLVQALKDAQSDD